MLRFDAEIAAVKEKSIENIADIKEKPVANISNTYNDQKLCSNCGAQIEEDAFFCCVCGHKIEEE